MSGAPDVTPRDLSAPDLTAVVGSRICHDLISPIGAIGNGVELMVMSNPARSPELDLIAESAGSANARIRFFRVAFGAATADQRIAGPELGGIMRDLWEGSRLELSWPSVTDLPRPEARLICLLLLCFEAALPRGGRIAITTHGPGWKLRAEASRLRIDRALWAFAPARGDVPVRPADVQFALVAEAAARLGTAPAVEITETSITVTL